MDPNEQASLPAKQQVVERLNQATNVLVTVSNNPSVDQLAACIGFTIMLNKLGKHGTAVFSGAVPSTIEFLQPEKTIRTNTDSLRDFIIALDKAKADKLRYKIEDKYVKIFITPYRASLSQKDLEFSEGDFNVDVVVALGVHRREELDQAITAHGRILHDATVISVNTRAGSDIGAINWRDDKASSLSEILVDLSELLKPGLLDAQIATAFLTGIVAETQRFSNAKTTPQTMSISAKLMNAGANQQLVATKLEPPKPIPSIQQAVGDKPFVARKMGGPAAKPPDAELPRPNDGSLQIPHDEDQSQEVTTNLEDLGDEEEKIDQIHIDDQGTLQREEEIAKAKAKQLRVGQNTITGPGPASRFMLDPPAMGGTLTANSRPEDLELSSDPLSTAPASPTPILRNPAQYGQSTKLEKIEESAHSSHTTNETASGDTRQLDNLAQAAKNLASSSDVSRPLQGLGTTPVDLDLRNSNGGAGSGGSGPSAPPVPPPMLPMPPSPTNQNNTGSIPGVPL